VITGTVTPAREAVLCLSVYDARGKMHETRVVVDTGFDGWLTLPPSFIIALGLTWKRFERLTLADGNAILTNVYDATVEWDGHEVTVLVIEADADPIVGMSLMCGFELTMPILEGATFKLRRIPRP
jgi:clan AA aspartic protease